MALRGWWLKTEEQLRQAITILTSSILNAEKAECKESGGEETDKPHINYVKD